MHSCYWALQDSQLIIKMVQEVGSMEVQPCMHMHGLFSAGVVWVAGM